ncbi:hypothetical protein O181_099043 [Austropuccinia psidii MF-1]|uniref:Uncharacterized protein n=1 Tax=Austropuccinia psidii MF-1 TaxID=1389203 RepID=A0A9Q3JAC9_9BASI|nr:hypothetical protein [Austropuccinia psidii MF-1]
MSSKLTELTESSPSAPPPSVLRGFGVFSQFSSPSMASSGHFYPSQTYDDYKAVEVLDPFWPGARIAFNTTILDLQSAITFPLERGHVVVLGCQLLMSVGIYGVGKMGLLGKSSQSLRHLLLMELQGFLIVSNFSILIEFGTDILDLVTGSRQRDVGRWINVGGSIPVGGRPIYSSSEVPISRINTEEVVKRVRRIADSPTDPDAEDSDELEGEEFLDVPHSVGHPSRNSSAQPLANRFQSQVIPSTPRTFQPVLASIPTTIPPSSPSTSHARPALNPEVRPSPRQKPRNSHITTSQQLQPVASSSRRRDGLSPLPFPAAQVFQRRDCWPIQITREDPNTASESQEAVARLFRRVDRNSREVIIYSNDRTILGTASKEMAAKFSWY